MRVSKTKPVFLILPILLVYAVIQSIGISAPLLHGDDQQQMAFVNGLSNWWKLFGSDVFHLFRPVKNLFFFVFSVLSTDNLALSRVLAISIGCASFFPVYAFFQKVFANSRKAILASAIWLLAPTLVSSVSWLSCVNIQLMCAFVALSAANHLASRPFRAAFWLFVACVSYEQAVAVAPILVALDFFLKRGCRNFRAYAIYLVATVVYLVLRVLVGSTGSVNGSFAGCDRLDIIFASAYLTLLHFSTWFHPFGRMAVFGSYSAGLVPTWQLVASWAVVAFLIVAAFALRHRAPLFAAGIALALVAFLPVSNVTGIGNGPYGDYYLGLPSLGFALSLTSLVASLFATIGIWRRVAVVAAVALLAIRALAVVESVQWVRCWTNPELAYLANICTFPDSYYAHIRLASVYCDSRRYAEALAECDAAEAITGSDDEKASSVYQVRALCALMGSRDAKAALAALDKVESLAPYAGTRRMCSYYRGCVYEDLLNDLDAAKRAYAGALPDFSEKWCVEEVQSADRLARLLAIGGDLKRAVELWEHAAMVCPANAAIRQNLLTARKMLHPKR